MILFNKTTSIFALLILTALLIGCKKNKTRGEQHQEIEKEPTTIEIVQNEISINTFSEIPKKMYGCGCVFSKDKAAFDKREYIYAYSFDDISIMNINGKIIEFAQEEYINSEDGDSQTSKAETEDYILMLDMKIGRNVEYERQIYNGTLTIIDKKAENNKVVQTFYGTCGC